MWEKERVLRKKEGRTDLGQRESIRTYCKCKN